MMEIDPELVVPDPSLTINEGAILPWSSGATSYYEQIAQAIAERYEVDVDSPWEDLPEEVQNLFLYGTNGEKLYVTYRNRMGRKRSYMTTFEGIVPNLERRYKETDSDWSREKIEEYMSMRPCPECHGARPPHRAGARRRRDPGPGRAGGPGRGAAGALAPAGIHRRALPPDRSGDGGGLDRLQGAGHAVDRRAAGRG